MLVKEPTANVQHTLLNFLLLSVYGYIYANNKLIFEKSEQTCVTVSDAGEITNDKDMRRICRWCNGWMRLGM